MSKSARSSRAPRPEKRCGVARLPWVAILLSASFAFAILCTILGLLGGEMKPDPRPADWNRRKLDHKPKSLMSSQVRNLASLIDFHRLWNVFLVPMLIERYPGSKGIQFVRQHIRGHMESLSARWALELDTFEERTPFGKRTFSNVVATLDPSARRRLVLACHYDSKYFPADDRGRVYVGATDSAVPCSMMLELVTSLDKELLKLKERRQDLTLQLLFLDGEEALVSWSPTDSLYGSRHLAEQMARTKHPEGSSSTTLIDSVDLFVLLDLLGVSKPVFLNHFQNTARWFSRLVGIEKRLHRLGLLQLHPFEVTYFNGNTHYAPIEDDHVPFLQKGVPVLHLIATPRFPGSGIRWRTRLRTWTPPPSRTCARS
ncbi:glutaminyl-peptide cyclotransferase-like isoform X2 [Hypanus sabinus]|uniref:glutaminyl-peptide cyclotransferase-like isoform X2 n=1 Tax=Hypanus sabinus TaxID=79690 RepID=UPI0028C47CB7|nr:glutaminyl-peptide cyclotransferase-like isoform X2 [Hypanus sabinus]